jgi:hypothetical protein
MKIGNEILIDSLRRTHRTKWKGECPMMEQAKLLAVALAVFSCTALGLFALYNELRQPWPVEGSDGWTQLAIAEQPPVSYLITP